MNERSHFGAKTILEHLKSARAKGKEATESHHCLETPGHLIGAADAARDVALLTMILSILFNTLNLDLEKTLLFLSLVMFAMLLWRTGRGGLLGWNRLERLNKLIADEKHEIEHNREEEKLELTEMYQAKGFSGPLLEKVIDVLMADDNKLLSVMLEEELGVSLESYEHPLKQAAGTAAGVFIASCFLILSLLIDRQIGPLFAGYLVIFCASILMAKIEKIRLVNTVVWNLSLTFLATMGTYFIAKWIS